MTFTAKALCATFDSGKVAKRGKSYKSCFRQIVTSIRTLLVLMLLLSGLQTAPVWAGLPSDFRPTRTALSGVLMPPPQALTPGQGAKFSNPDPQMVVPGSGAAYDIPPQIVLPDSGAFQRNLRLRLPTSRIVAAKVQTSHAPRAPPKA